MKNLFIIIVSLMLVACSSEPELLIEKFHDEYFKGFGTKGAENRYWIDKHIYIYAAYDRQSIIDDYSGIPGCVIHVYNLETSSALSGISVDKALRYLNEIDTPSGAKWLPESSVPSSYYLVGENPGSVRSIWFKQSELPKDIFNPFNVDLSDFYQDKNKVQSPVKTDLDECLKFLYDGSDKQTYTEKYRLDFLEKYREGIAEKYTRLDFVDALQDQDTLIRMDPYCRSNITYFFNTKRSLFIVASSGREKYPNPFCS
ncbi:hypothetical protein [Neisseria shayeganii]|uniref:Lipoprotein n=1 Tax=Neisseria shayeganii TaxID=607712 RepID=A0A7D7SJ93_9NEIS|nr:hypothetical protein [Neisseria shayeganii]QMT41307.1 hypothetical protein H3L94_04585 [Neisseria shayeganii]